ncbi:hypothetical protein RRG08_056480 [Elysia crispata]|uniref:Uncharacterized protein n=1 Tax=Elysia crispata TaxID=231223 RepID=A0AAE0XSJ8_9GAST|nr:hypothetical protein RRG08_056480 [Elysia crispata]
MERDNDEVHRFATCYTRTIRIERERKEEQHMFSTCNMDTVTIKVDTQRGKKNPGSQHAIKEPQHQKEIGRKKDRPDNRINESVRATVTNQIFGSLATRVTLPLKPLLD